MLLGEPAIIAQHLPQGQPVWEVQSKGHSGDPPPLLDMAECSQRCVSASAPRLPPPFSGLSNEFPLRPLSSSRVGVCSGSYYCMLWDLLAQRDDECPRVRDAACSRAVVTSHSSSVEPSTSICQLCRTHNHSVSHWVITLSHRHRAHPES